MYVADRSKKLKHLRIGHDDIHISDDGLIEAVRKLPMLEEIEFIMCDFLDKTFEALGHACPSLKSFSLNYVVSSYSSCLPYNEEALAVAKSMPNLRRLQLIGNCMSNEGLKAILDGCPLLESLDLRACFNIDLSRDLGERVDKIKHLRHPNDSTADFSHHACSDVDDYPCWADVPEIEYGSPGDFCVSDSNSSGDIHYASGMHPGYSVDFDEVLADDYYGLC